MVFVDVFKTEKDSVYQFDPESGLWRRTNKPRSWTAVYFGSINPKENHAFFDSSFDNKVVSQQLNEGNIIGFVPEFRVGYQPFGIMGSFDQEYNVKGYVPMNILRSLSPDRPTCVDCVIDDMVDGTNVPKPKNPGIFIVKHIGHKIAEIYQEIIPLQRRELQAQYRN